MVTMQEVNMFTDGLLQIQLCTSTLKLVIVKYMYSLLCEYKYLICKIFCVNTLYFNITILFINME